MINPVAWFESHVDDLARARAFYETVLDLKLAIMENAPVELPAVPSQQGTYGASGALVRMPGMPVGGNSVLVYFACEDCAVTAARVPAAGGRIEKPKMSIGPYGPIALAVDTEGNRFGLHSMQ